MSSPLPEFQIVADLGNTRSKFALLRANPTRNLPETVHSLVFENGGEIDLERVAALIDRAESPDVRLIFAGSHLARLDELVSNWPEKWGDPQAIRKASQIPMKLLVDSPELVGVDRVLNGYAAHWEHPDTACIIIDSGTATTIDVVSEEGAFMGGAIMPGFEMSSRALHDYTNRLPHIPLETSLNQLPDAVGKNTEQAVRSGLIWGHIGAVNEIVRQMIESLGGSRTPTLILTGGAAPLLADQLEYPAVIRPQLTLQGLAMVPAPASE